MSFKSILNKVKIRLDGFFQLILKQRSYKSFQRYENLTSIPGIGSKNCSNFYQAGYKTPESILEASDEELLSIPGVGTSFIKRLRAD